MVSGCMVMVSSKLNAQFMRLILLLSALASSALVLEAGRRWS